MNNKDRQKRIIDAIRRYTASQKEKRVNDIATTSNGSTGHFANHRLKLTVFMAGDHHRVPSGFAPAPGPSVREWLPDS